MSEGGTRGFDVDWLTELEDGRFVVASEGDRPVGFVSIVDPCTDPYWGEMPPGLRAIDIIIGAPDRLGDGLGSEMLDWALESVFADPSVEAVVVDPLASNERAIRFFRRQGFSDLERRRFDDDSDCLVLRLTRSDWEGRN